MKAIDKISPLLSQKETISSSYLLCDFEDATASNLGTDLFTGKSRRNSVYKIKSEDF